MNLNRVKQPAKATSLHTQLHAMHTRAQNTTMKQEISIYLFLFFGLELLLLSGLNLNLF